MLHVELKLYNENEFVKSTFKDFKDKDELYSFLQRNSGHPFLSYTTGLIQETHE